MSLNFLMTFQVLVSTATTSLLRGLGESTETNILEPSTEKPRWNGLGYWPTHSGSSTNVTFFHRRGSGSDVSKIGMLFCRRLFIIVKNFPSGENPASWAGFLTSSNVTSQASGPEATCLTGRLPGEPLGMCRQVTGSQVVRSTIRAAEHKRRITADHRLLGWWTTASSPVRVSGESPGIWPRSTSSSAIGTISQLILFPLVPSNSYLPVSFGSTRRSKRKAPPPDQQRSSEDVSLGFQSPRKAIWTLVFSRPRARLKNAAMSFWPSAQATPSASG